MPKLLQTFPQLKGVKIDYRWTGNFLLTLSRMPQSVASIAHLLHAGLQRPRRHLYPSCRAFDCRTAARRRRRFDAFANLPHYPFPGGRTLRVPFTAMGAAITACAIVWRLISD
ncbi:hypothetical protein ACLK19_08885 [Escherichia coli]